MIRIQASAALRPGEGPRYPLRGSMGPRAALDLRSRVPVPGIEPQFLGRLARGLLPILTELSRPWLCFVRSWYIYQ